MTCRATTRLQFEYVLHSFALKNACTKGPVQASRIWVGKYQRIFKSTVVHFSCTYLSFCMPKYVIVVTETKLKNQRFQLNKRLYKIFQQVRRGDVLNKKKVHKTSVFLKYCPPSPSASNGATQHTYFNLFIQSLYWVAHVKTENV